MDTGTPGDRTDDPKVTEGDLAEYAELDLPEGVTFEDALRGFTEVDPEKVKEAEKGARKPKKKERDEE